MKWFQLCNHTLDLKCSVKVVVLYNDPMKIFLKEKKMVLEFFRWTIQLHTSLYFLPIELLFNFYVKKTVRRQDFGAKFNLTYHNGAPVADILKSQYQIFLERA